MPNLVISALVVVDAQAYAHNVRDALGFGISRVNMAYIQPGRCVRIHHDRPAPIVRFEHMSNLFVPVILGTARPGRRSETVAIHVVDTVKQRGLTTELIDVADYALTGTERPAQGLSRDHYGEIVAAADGLIIVAPEYNHGYPGELKMLLDGEYDAYVRKPVGFVSVSSGLIGGARVTEQLRLITAALRMVPVSPAVHVIEAADAMDDRGAFVSESLGAVLTDMLAEVEWYARVLTRARAADV